MTERFSAPGRHAGQAVRPARPRSRAEFARPGRPGARHRGAHRDGAVGLRHRADAGLGAGAGAGLRPRRLAARCAGTLDAGRRRGAGAAAHPALRAADRAGQRPGRRHERAGQLRAGLRGARPRAADQQKPRRRRRCPTARSSVEFDDVRFAYPSADKVSLASLEEVATLDTRGGDEVLHGIVVPGRARADWSRWSARRARASRRSRRCCPRLYDVDAGAVRARRASTCAT